MTNAPKSLTRDHLTTTTDACKIELAEQELSRVTGGEYFKIHLGAQTLKIPGVDAFRYIDKVTPLF